MTNLLIVEDEKNLARGLKLNLEMEGYLVDTVESGEQALPIFSKYNLMILDIMLPEMSGIDLLKKIREMDPRYSVLILSAKSTEPDLLEGLSAGADDYMTKPFSITELTLRIKRILKRQAWYSEAIIKNSFYAFGQCWIKFDTFEAKTLKGLVKLTQYECFVMKYLIEHKDRTISREELLTKVWGYSEEAETRTVDAFIGRLRKLFEEDTKNPKHIVSTRSVGYRFRMKNE